jgi:hypothetical protein
MYIRLGLWWNLHRVAGQLSYSVELIGQPPYAVCKLGAAD